MLLRYMRLFQAALRNILNANNDLQLLHLVE